MTQPGQLNINSYINANTGSIQHVRLFEHEELRAYLVVLPAGASIADHVHENAHELFDIISGGGSMVVDGLPIECQSGKCVFVPAGTRHSMVNTGVEPWTVRITYQDRIYPRHIGKLLGRAIRKRLG